MVVLLSQSFLVALRRGALLPGLAVRGPAARTVAAGADRGEPGDLAGRHAGPRRRCSRGSELVEHRGPDAIQAGWPGAGRLSGDHGAPARWIGSTGARFAEGRRRD